MIAIKDMEMPNSCAECDFVVDDMCGGATCILLCDEWKDNENHRAENCPLVEDVVEREKIDKAIEKINDAEVEVDFMNDYADGFNSGLFKALEILKNNIGESKKKSEEE